MTEYVESIRSGRIFEVVGTYIDPNGTKYLWLVGKDESLDPTTFQASGFKPWEEPLFPKKEEIWTNTMGDDVEILWDDNLNGTHVFAFMFVRNGIDGGVYSRIGQQRGWTRKS